MSDPKTILRRARRLGLSLCVEGDRIAIAPARLCPPELLADLREHKPVVISLLEADSANLPTDCAPWLHTARQILAGEFHGADRSMIESLKFGLRNIKYPSAQRAYERLVSYGSKTATS